MTTSVPLFFQIKAPEANLTLPLKNDKVNTIFMSTILEALEYLMLNTKFQGKLSTGS